VLLCPLAAHLRAHGAEEVAVVTKSAYAGLFAAAVGVGRVTAFDARGGIRALTRIADDYRGRGYRVIDAHNNLRSRFLSMRLGGADARFRKFYGPRLRLIWFKRPARLPSILEQYGALAAAVGMPAARLAPGGIEVPARYATDASERMSGDAHPHVAMAPGAKWPEKRWPLDRYVELARRLVEHYGYRLLVLGDQLDRAAGAAIAQQCGDMCLDMTGRTGIIEAAAYLQRCSGFVGNDSGLAHLAEAVGVPVVVLYGPTVESFGYYPSLPSSKTIEHDLPCRPCSRNGSRQCPKRTRECLGRIGVSTVEAATLDMLSNSGPERYVLTS
jgi:heptosyltransferase-2